jgi:hypothetical protein
MKEKKLNGLDLLNKKKQKNLNILKNTCILVKLKVNWEHKRVKHALERMWLRGISSEDIITAIRRGQKRKQTDSGLIESFYSYFSVVYDERFFKDIDLQKIYPVTVKVW